MKRERLAKVAAGLAAGLLLLAFVVSRISFLSSMPRPIADIYLEAAHSGIALAPDGSALAYTVTHDGESILELRWIADGAVRRLARAKQLWRPFFSPDGRRLAFVDGGALRRVDLDSFDVEEMSSLEDVADGSFRDDGSLLATTSTGLFLLSPAGEAEEVLPEGVHSPLSIPRSEWVVFETRAEDGPRVEVFSLSNGARRAILSRASLPRFSSSGHLVFLRESAIWASRFDARKAELIGSPAPLIAGADWFDVAANGTLAFRSTSGPRPVFRVILHWDVELSSRIR